MGMSGKGQEVFGLVVIDFFIFSGFPFMYPPSLFYILIFPSVSFLGTGLLMSPLAALSPMIWREHWCPYCCEKADRLQRGHRRTGGDVDPTCASGLAELGFLPFSLPFSFHVLPRKGKKHLVVICFGMFCPVSGLVAASCPGILVNFEF